MKSLNAQQKIITLIKQLKLGNEIVDTEELLVILYEINNLCIDKSTINVLIKSIKYLKTKDVSKIKKITDRETEVLILISEGLQSNIIAKKLNLSKSTVETHRKNIRKKLNIKGKDSLYAFALVFSLQSKRHQIIGG